MSPTSGWGLLGLNLAIQAEMDGTFRPVPFVKTILPNEVAPAYKPIVEQFLKREGLALQLIAKNAGQVCRCDFPVIHALGNRLASSDAAEKVVGTQNFAVIFFEDTQIDASALQVAARFELILAGSTWNRDVLHQRGIKNAAVLLQGVDLSLFHPAEERSPGQRFLIFSGGKLEYRKGQDIVIGAVRKFRNRHPEAQLVTAWHNHWPKSMEGIQYKGYVEGTPQVNSNGLLETGPWLERNGIPAGASHHFGIVPNHLMAKIYHQVDVAVFPNRCEGGTNLAAMECLACGIPTILSTNTGHLDLVDENHCYPLRSQGPVQPLPPYRGTDGWGESDVDEVVEALELVYSDRQEAERRGRAAAVFMQAWSWDARYRDLLRHLGRSIGHS